VALSLMVERMCVVPFAFYGAGKIVSNVAGKFACQKYWPGHRGTLVDVSCAVVYTPKPGGLEIEFPAQKKKIIMPYLVGSASESIHTNIDEVTVYFRPLLTSMILNVDDV
jgi:hypothetical protein